MPNKPATLSVRILLNRDFLGKRIRTRRFVAMALTGLLLQGCGVGVTFPRHQTFDENTRLRTPTKRPPQYDIYPLGYSPRDKITRQSLQESWGAGDHPHEKWPGSLGVPT